MQKILKCKNKIVIKTCSYFSSIKNFKTRFANIKKSKIKFAAISVVGGLFIGFINGFFGGGGGMIVVPLFTFLLGLSEKQAHATAIFTILPISIASSIIYLLNKSVPLAELGYVSIGFTMGGVIGAMILKKINNKWLKIIFALVMIAAGIKILV